MDWLLSGFKWWRKFKGGIWWVIDIPTVGGTLWVNKQPETCDRCWIQEDYTRANNSPASDRDLYLAVRNIANNGQWRFTHNLDKFLFCAKVMRDSNIASAVIIKRLTDVYSAAQREKVELNPRDFEWEEIEAILKDEFP
jgi:hypothetical protein